MSTIVGPPDDTPPRRGRPPRATTRCERLAVHLRGAGYPRVADNVAPQGDVVPVPFHDPEDGMFRFVLRPARYGSSERILFAIREGRVVASETEVLQLRPGRDTDGAKAAQVSLRGLSSAARASLVRAARRAGVSLPKYCVAVLTAAASVEDQRKAAAALPAEARESMRVAMLADPELGQVPDTEIAMKYGCTTTYVQKIRAQNGIPPFMPSMARKRE